MKEKQENPFLSLVLNIVIPSLVLMKLSGDDHLGPQMGLVVALAFPIVYGIWDLAQRGKVNFISVLGVISILLTGGIGLLKLDPHWIAVKEAAVPGMIGLAVLISLKTRYPLVKTFLLNEKIINLALVNQRLQERKNVQSFEDLLTRSSYLLAFSFFLSAALNYILAKIVLTSAPGTEAFNEELGKMTALSYPVIVIPSMIVMMLALWLLIRGIKSLTGLKLDDVLTVQEKAKG